MSVERIQQPSLLPPEMRSEYLRPVVPTIPEGYESEVLPPTGEKLRMEVHKDHAFEVIDTLMEAYQNNEFPYSLDTTRVPQDVRHMPKTLELGTVDHAMFFFNVCYYMRGGTKSNDAVKRMSRLYDRHPELFNAQTAAEYDPEEMIPLLADVGLGMHSTAPFHWVKNSQRLVELYDGDPRRIFDDVAEDDDPYDLSLQRVANQKGAGFVGFQKKMTSMLIYYLMEQKLIDEFAFPLPVDVHVMRVSIANEMLTFPDAPYGTNLFTGETTDALRELYFSYVMERGADSLELSNAVWMLSEALCGKTPGNITFEPHGRDKRNGRATYLVPQVVDPYNRRQREAYADSCNECPVQETCEFNIPGKPYNVGGALIIRGKRVRFTMTPRSDVLLLDPEDITED